MKFSPIHAKLLLSLIGGMPLERICEAGCMEAVASLHAHSKGNMVEVWINIPNGKWVEGIKMIRMLTGWGLKEAKDWLEDRDEERMGGTHGPVLSVMDNGDAVREILRRNSPSCVGVEFR